MHTTKRGEPLPINGALNRPRTKLGLELSAWMSIVFVTDGFPRRFQMACHLQLSCTATRCMARGPQAPQDVPTLVSELEAEELL
jgi:hypothetical protein